MNRPSPFFPLGIPCLSPAAPATPPLPPDPLAEQRRTRRHDQLAAALHAPDPLQANMGASLCDLLDIADHVVGAMRPQLAGGTADGLQQARPLLNDYLRLMRQIDRLANFELRLRQTQQAQETHAAAASADEPVASSEENAL